MTSHLLLVALGPVQEFIAQARRTRDLWFGSHFLSELGRCAARALVDGGAQLIFPALAEGELVASPGLLRENGRPPQNVANKLLAEVPSGVDPQKLASHVRAALMAFWRDEVAASVKQKCRGLLAEDIDGVWREQIETFLEFQATWAPFDGRPYREVREAVEHSLAACKALRDFEPWIEQRRGVNKSTLDGARETVLAHHSRRDRSRALEYRIDEREELDAIGLIKRAGGNPGQFVPIVNVAAAGWLECAQHDASAKLGELIKACKAIEPWRQSPVRQSLPVAKLFGFEASVLYFDRLPRVWRDFVPSGPGAEHPVTIEQWRALLAPLYERCGEPGSYVACLVADGDGMGKALDALGSADAHRAVSRALAGFNEDARSIVERDHLGALVYAGGDDVLAFVPLHRALACADALRRCFATVVAAALPAGGAGGAVKAPTLSVGVGVGHMLESLGDLLALGRRAEKIAKGASLRGVGLDRNALAVLVKKRTGDERQWRGQWGGDPVARLQRLIEANDRLPSRKVYEIARLLARLPAPGKESGPAWAGVLALEVGRALSRVNGGETPVAPEEVGLPLVKQVADEASGGVLGAETYARLFADVTEWVEQMLIARTFAQAKSHEARGTDHAAADHQEVA